MAADSPPDRRALDGSALTRALISDGSLWREIRVVAETGSTNEDVAAAARNGAPEGLVIVAEAQTTGRGRFDRRWVSPPRAGLTFSALLRPGPAVPVQRWSWLPLLAGLALQRAVSRLAAVPAALKWPNDLLLGAHRRKAAGLLVQAVDGAAVLGIGLNVTTTAAELPDDAQATSIAIETAAPARGAVLDPAGPGRLGATRASAYPPAFAPASTAVDRQGLLIAVLDRLAADYLAWRSADGDPDSTALRSAYLDVCDTVGRPVRVTQPDGAGLTGIAITIDGTGRLVLRTPGGDRAVSAGDVHHLRPAAGA